MATPEKRKRTKREANERRKNLDIPFLLKQFI